jgi:hypothetical protein
MANAQSATFELKDELKHSVGVCFAEKVEIGSARAVLKGREYIAGAEDGAYTAFRKKINKTKATDGFWTLSVRVPNVELEPCVISVLNISPQNSKTVLFLLKTHVQRLGYVSKSIALTSGRNISGYTRDDKDFVFVALPRGKTLNITLSDPS